MDLGNTYRSKSGNLRFAAAESLSLAAFHFGGSVSQLVQCPSTARSGPTPCALFLMGLALFVETAKTWDYFSIFRLIPAAAQTDWNSVPAGRSPVGAHRFVFQINSSLGAEIAHCAYARMGGSIPHLKPLRNLISLALALVLALPLHTLRGQTPQTPSALNIVVVEGEGVIHNVQERSRRDPAVRIEDQNGAPIKEAAVVFTLPTEGSSGEFGNGSKTLTLVTGVDGLAKAQGLQVSRVNGKLPIHVSASYRGLSARTIINQFIEGAPPGATGRKSGGNGKLIAILAIVGAGAAGGAYYAIAGKNSSTPATTPTPPSGPTPIGITPVGPTIAPPR
jgi:hypothetical protein